MYFKQVDPGWRAACLDIVGVLSGSRPFSGDAAAEEAADINGARRNAKDGGSVSRGLDGMDDDEAPPGMGLPKEAAVPPPSREALDGVRRPSAFGARYLARAMLEILE